MDQYRIKPSRHSFDLQKRDAKGNYRTIAYCRNRRDLLSSLRAHKLPEDLANSVPRFHTNSLESLANYGLDKGQ